MTGRHIANFLLPGTVFYFQSDESSYCDSIRAEQSTFNNVYARLSGYYDFLLRADYPETFIPAACIYLSAVTHCIYPFGMEIQHKVSSIFCVLPVFNKIKPGDLKPNGHVAYKWPMLTKWQEAIFQDGQNIKYKNIKI